MPRVHALERGSSPHMRGAPVPARGRGAGHGIIPAHAGSTGPVAPVSPLGPDHPRTCGEHSTMVPLGTESVGSSPHMRGAQSDSACGRQRVRIIPAHAGSTKPPAPVWGSGAGSSPHMRGAPRRRGRRGGPAGIIPAHAGSTMARSPTAPRPSDHPRTCGEHRVYSPRRPSTAGSSPHMRGAHHQRRRRPGHPGIIPAHAGSTRRPT